jgi:hypothetical protein
MLSLQNCGIFKTANMVLRILIFTITYECEEGFLNLLQIKGNHGHTLNMEGSLQYKQQAQLCHRFYYYGQKHIIDVFHIIILSFRFLLSKFMCISKANQGKPSYLFFFCVHTEYKCNFCYVCIWVSYMLTGSKRCNLMQFISVF